MTDGWRICQPGLMQSCPLACWLQPRADAACHLRGVVWDGFRVCRAPTAARSRVRLSALCSLRVFGGSGAGCGGRHPYAGAATGMECLGAQAHSCCPHLLRIFCINVLRSLRQLCKNSTELVVHLLEPFLRHGTGGAERQKVPELGAGTSAAVTPSVLLHHHASCPRLPTWPALSGLKLSKNCPFGGAAEVSAMLLCCATSFAPFEKGDGDAAVCVCGVMPRIVGPCRAAPCTDRARMHVCAALCPRACLKDAG